MNLSMKKASTVLIGLAFAVPLAMALGSDRESDVKQLIEVSDALRNAV